jgi:preprotein translocase subunit SecA
MDELKQSVQLAVHEQKDPLIYKFEAFNLFNGMLNGVNKVISFLFKGDLPQQSAQISKIEVRERKKIIRVKTSSK